MNIENIVSFFLHWQQLFLKNLLLLLLLLLPESADLIIYRVFTKNNVLRKRPITLSKLTTGGVSLQNKKETDLANLIKSNI